MIHSNDLTARHPVVDGNGRMLIVRFRTAQLSEIVVAGYHAVDGINYPQEARRGGYSALARRELDTLADRTVPIAVMGDFNASPHALELVDRACFYVLRKTSHRHQSGREEHFGKASRPLFIIQPQSRSCFVAYGGRTPGWEEYDFIALSAELERNNAPIARVLDSVCNITLLDRQGTPNKAVYSDHLPVECDLHFS